MNLKTTKTSETIKNDDHFSGLIPNKIIPLEFGITLCLCMCVYYVDNFYNPEYLSQLQLTVTVC